MEIYIIDYNLYQSKMATTIAVKESTVEKLKRIMKTRHTKSLDQTINSLIESAEAVPLSMFGVDKRRHIILSRREHVEFQKSDRP
jgi:hypothetical protein